MIGIPWVEMFSFASELTRKLRAAARAGACAVLSLVAVATPCLAQVVPIEVGGMRVMIPIPEGWCLIPEPNHKAAIEFFNRASPLSVASLMFGDCEQIRAGQKHHGRVRDYVVVAAPRGSLSDDQGTDRLRLIDKMEGTINRLVPKATGESQPARPDGAGRGGLLSYDVMSRDANGLYVGRSAPVRGVTGDFRQASVTAYTLLNRRMVYYHAYTDYESEQSLPVLLKWTRTELARTVANN